MSLADLLAEARTVAAPQLRYRGVPVHDVTDRLLEDAASFGRRLSSPPDRAVVRAARSKIPYKATNTESNLFRAIPKSGIYLGGWANVLVFAMPRRLKRVLGGEISRTGTREAGAMIRLMQRGLVRAFQGPTQDLTSLFPSLRSSEIAGERSVFLLPTSSRPVWRSQRAESFDNPYLSRSLGSLKRTERQVVAFLPHPSVEYLWVEVVRAPSGRAELGRVVDYAMSPQPGVELKSSERRQLLDQARAQVAELLDDGVWS